MNDIQDVFIVVMFLIVFGLMFLSNQGEKEKLKKEIEDLKAECIAKNVAEYGFDAKGKVVFRIKERQK